MKKIGVIGTSNSVMVNNYIAALKIDFEVVNFSSGRVPVFFHIRTFLNFKAEISSCDYIIIDHYINDYNFYNNKLGTDYIKHIENFYLMLSGLNIPIVNMFFPVFGIDNDSCYYKDVLRLSNEYGFYSLNLNDYDFQKEHFSDSIHLIKEISFLVGLELSNYLKNNNLDIVSRINFSEDPNYYIVSAKDISSQTTTRLFSFKNRLMNFDYIEIGSSIYIDIKEGATLVSIGYYNPEKDVSYGISIDGHNYSLSGVKYFHEAISSQSTDSIINLRPLTQEDKAESLMGRESVQSKELFFRANIVELLLFTNTFSQNKIKSAHVKIDLDLNTRLKGLFPVNSRLIAETDIDIIRDAATKIGERDLNLSLDLISIAKRTRPKGPFIIKKYNELSLLKKQVYKGVIGT
jgi:hypothetical protein